MQSKLHNTPAWKLHYTWRRNLPDAAAAAMASYWLERGQMRNSCFFKPALCLLTHTIWKQIGDL
jgi:hypothetical protein